MKEKGYELIITGFKGVSNTFLRTHFRKVFGCDWVSINSVESKIIIKVSFKLTQKKVKRFAAKLGDYVSPTFEEGTFTLSV